jgi:hypothetical protein
MANLDAPRSFAGRDSDDYARHGPSDAGSFGSAGLLLVVLAAGHLARSCHLTSVTAATDQHLSAAQTAQEKIARACYPARPDMDEVHDGWHSIRAPARRRARCRFETWQFIARDREEMRESLSTCRARLVPMTESCLDAPLIYRRTHKRLRRARGR